uniref:Uncharacterized protein n=1 Tax=Physcomitrium patens TaxID=3218 RepID=A0A2K1KA15_PHYPA|nr:hypothetical protein PHYPA_009809 [Physcomitrium patens]
MVRPQNNQKLILLQLLLFVTLCSLNLCGCHNQSSAFSSYTRKGHPSRTGLQQKELRNKIIKMLNSEGTLEKDISRYLMCSIVSVIHRLVHSRKEVFMLST